MFSILSSDGDARTGTLSSKDGKTISTPVMMVSTRRGNPLNLTPDIFDNLHPKAQALQIGVFQILDQIKAIKNFNGTARQYLGINNYVSIIACTRDPTAYEFWGPLRQSTDAAASVHCPGGARTVTPEEFTEAAIALQPDFLTIISDDIPYDSKRDRAVVSINRSLVWIQQCFDIAQQNSNSSPLPPVFLTVQGSHYTEERQRASKLLNDHYLNNNNTNNTTIAGISIGGLGTGESPDQRKEIISTVLQEIPSNTARMVSSIGTPDEILLAVQQGIDIFDVGYLADITAEGFALNFPLHPQDNDNNSSSDNINDNSGCDDTKMNLWSTSYKTDKRPLVDGCPCVACQQHTRGYIHHLLQSHEMTAQVLLEIHNTTHYLRFFENIQSAIEEKRFGKYCEWMLYERKRKWMMTSD